ncbi:MAG: hypothetical protein ACMG6S_05070 [Byssovorax sp.]
MEFIVNDCSLHGQFPTTVQLLEALKRLLAIRNRVEQSGRVVRCPRRLLDAVVGSDMSLRQILGSMPDRNLRSVFLTWLANKGPFWDDEPLHRPDDWFAVNGEIVTETGLGEAAMGVLHGLPRSVLSFAPSSWTHSPVDVEYVPGSSQSQIVQINNHWTLPAVEQHLRETRPPLTSWEALVQWAREECPRITLTHDVIRGLDGHPFIPGAAERFQVLLSTLDRLKSNLNESGAFTEEGMRLYQAHFVGGKVWFTDSSDSEKIDFKNELTFPDPDKDGSTLFCPMHGKVKIEQMRMHFAFPLRFDAPLYVVYIGPKLTKR